MEKRLDENEINQKVESSHLTTALMKLGKTKIR